jgi:hypothetical protein
MGINIIDMALEKAVDLTTASKSERLFINPF